RTIVLPEPHRAEEARQQVVKSGPEIKYVLTETYSGVLYGIRGGRFFTDTLYGGLVGYGALPLIGREFAPAFDYLGLMAGHEGRLPYGVGYDLTMMAAWTQNLTERDVALLSGQPSFEPGASLSVPVPLLRGTRLAFALGYLWMPLSSGLSGPTFGLHLDFKALEYRFAIDD
ncbi:MAG: hypothetical protein ACLGIN_11030, partial [Candidatus Sericytochromatia bacterium]